MKSDIAEISIVRTFWPTCLTPFALMPSAFGLHRQPPPPPPRDVERRRSCTAVRGCFSSGALGILNGRALGNSTSVDGMQVTHLENTWIVLYTSEIERASPALLWCAEQTLHRVRPYRKGNSHLHLYYVYVRDLSLAGWKVHRRRPDDWHVYKYKLFLFWKNNGNRKTLRHKLLMTFPWVVGQRCLWNIRMRCSPTN